MSVGISIKVVREVTTNELFDKPLRAFFTDVMWAAVEDVAQPGRVPIDTGRLRGSLQPGAGTSEVDSSHPPQWAQIGTDIDYGKKLEKEKHYRYARGPSRGKPTRGWLSDTAKNIEAEVRGPLLAQLAADIEAAWRG
ncbi:MAG: hypothetical protein ACE5HE_15240 [Phycisphaerae bacterium]